MGFVSKFWSVGGRAPGMMRACSACAGDYEDPDRTAWATEDSAEAEVGDAPKSYADEFPPEK